MITTDDVFRIKYRVMQMLPTLRENPEYNSFKEKANDSLLLSSIDNECGLDDNHAHSMAKDVWLDVLRDHW